MKVDLTGKTALVTGGSRGIGLAIATRLHEAGAKVGVVARDGARAAEAAAGLGAGATAVAADVADSAQVAAAVERLEKELGPTDILVNNAGLTRDGVLVRMSDADWDTVLGANLKGAFNTMKVVTRGMMKRRGGRIINITSVVGLTGNKWPGKLRRVQGRTDRTYQVGRQGAGVPQHAGERGRPGFHRHGHDPAA